MQPVFVGCINKIFVTFYHIKIINSFSDWLMLINFYTYMRYYGKDYTGKISEKDLPNELGPNFKILASK